MDEFLDSVDGEDAVTTKAIEKINERFSTPGKTPRRFGSGRLQTDSTHSGRLALPSSAPTARAQNHQAPGNTCLFCGTPSGDYLYCSDEHEIAYAEAVLAKRQAVTHNNGYKPGNPQ